MNKRIRKTKVQGFLFDSVVVVVSFGVVVFVFVIAEL